MHAKVVQIPVEYGMYDFVQFAPTVLNQTGMKDCLIIKTAWQSKWLVGVKKRVKGRFPVLADRMLLILDGYNATGTGSASGAGATTISSSAVCPDAPPRRTPLPPLPSRSPRGSDADAPPR